MSEPGQSPNSDSDPTGDGGPCVRNTVSGVVSEVVQVGVVHDGVHLHPAPLSPARVLPRQLPAAPGLFTGRATELAELDRALTAATPDGQDLAVRTPAAADLPAALATVMIYAVAGAGGIGKTWLVLAWAHRYLDRFPDGQLFVDLQGFSPAGEPTHAGAAIRGFLDALGVEPGHVPATLDAQAGLYRSLVAGRRMLIVLDNAATADQVTPLLPGSPTCTVLITGRTRFASLIDRHSVRHLPLGALARTEARALLAGRIGADRAAAEPEAVDELVDLCRGYPLALSITARTAATRADIPLAEVATELRELRLEMLDHDTDPAASLPAVLSWSLRWLTDTQRTVFGLLGIAPGSDITLSAAISLTGLSPARARKALSALEEASLVDRRPGGRYAMHDLVCDYAVTIACGQPDDVRETALVRVMDFYLHTAVAAVHLLDPHHQLASLAPPVTGVHLLSLSEPAAAMTWLEAEHANLLATQRTAVALGHHSIVWHPAWTLDSFHLRRGHRRDAVVSWRAALVAAAHLPDAVSLSRAHRLLGYACSRLGLHEEAIGHLDRALALAVRRDDAAEQAHAHRAIASACGRRGDARGALDHARQALALCRTLGHPLWEAFALNQVGWHAARLGDFDTAHDHCLAAIALHRHHHYIAGEADTLDSLGLITHRVGDHRQAIDYYHQALTLLRTLRLNYRVADTLDRIGHPHAALGQHEQARGVWREALELYHEQGREIDVERLKQQLQNLDNHTGTNLSSA